jgi:hypothetical protein
METSTVIGLVLCAGMLGIVIVGLNRDYRDRERRESGHDRAEWREWHWYWNKDRNKDIENIPTEGPLS